MSWPEVVGDLSDPRVRLRNSSEEFSIVENLCHLRDIEIEGYETRINTILAESNPTLLDIDGARLAVERDYNQQIPTSALRDFSEARKRNVKVLRQLRAEQLDRQGSFEATGPVTIRRLLEMMHEHDEGHLSDLKRLV